MKIGIVSDLHGNIAGLDMALQRMGEVDEVWCPGDAFNQYRFSNAVVGRLKEINARYILGNHEDMLLGPAGKAARLHDNVDSDLLDWVNTRPHFVEHQCDGLKLLMFHSTPWPPYGEYI